MVHSPDEMHSQVSRGSGVAQVAQVPGCGASVCGPCVRGMYAWQSLLVSGAVQLCCREIGWRLVGGREGAAGV